MRIDCPHCGSRDSREFTVLGDASPSRPDPDGAHALAQFTAYVYERANPAGLYRELWYHGLGCQAWLVVTRDTRTHRVDTVEYAKSALGKEGPK